MIDEFFDDLPHNLYEIPFFLAQMGTTLLGAVVASSLGTFMWMVFPHLTGSYEYEMDYEEDEMNLEEEAGPSRPLVTLSSEENEYEQRLRETDFEGEVPENFIDPITRSIMFDPILLKTTTQPQYSQNYDKTSYNALVELKGSCSITRQPFNGFIPNHYLKINIERWVLEQEANKLPVEDRKKYIKEGLSKLPIYRERQRAFLFPPKIETSTSSKEVEQEHILKMTHN